MNIIFGLFSEGLLRSHKKSKILGKSREFGEWVLRKVLGMGWHCGWVWGMIWWCQTSMDGFVTVVLHQGLPMQCHCQLSHRPDCWKYVYMWTIHDEVCVVLRSLSLQWCFLLTSEVELYIIPQANLQIGGRDCHRQRHRSHASLAIGNECVPELSLNAKSYPLMVCWFLFLVCSPFLFRGLYSVYSLKSYHYTVTRDKLHSR